MAQEFETMRKCGLCKGTGSIAVLRFSGSKEKHFVECHRCGGTGKLSDLIDVNFREEFAKKPRIYNDDVRLMGDMLDTIDILKSDNENLKAEEKQIHADMFNEIERLKSEFQKLFSPDEICDMWPHLMEFVEGKNIEELDCSDRYMVKDALDSWRETRKMVI